MNYMKTAKLLDWMYKCYICWNASGAKKRDNSAQQLSYDGAVPHPQNVYEHALAICGLNMIG